MARSPPPSLTSVRPSRRLFAHDESSAPASDLNTCRPSSARSGPRYHLWSVSGEFVCCAALIYFIFFLHIHLQTNWFLEGFSGGRWAASTDWPAGIWVSRLPSLSVMALWHLSEPHLTCFFRDIFVFLPWLYCCCPAKGGMSSLHPSSRRPPAAAGVRRVALWLLRVWRSRRAYSVGGWGRLPFQLRFKSWPMNLSSSTCMIW